MPDTIDETIAALLEAGADEKEIPALLKEKFGKSSPPPSTPGAVSRFASGVWKNANPLAMVTGAVNAVSHPLDTYEALKQASADNFTEAGRLVGDGQYGHALHHGIAAVIPPYNIVTHAGDEMRKGNTAGGVGEAVGAGLVPAVVAEAPAVAKASLNGVNRAAVAGANVLEKNPALSTVAGAGLGYAHGGLLGAVEGAMGGGVLPRILKIARQMGPAEEVPVVKPPVPSRLVKTPAPKTNPLQGVVEEARTALENRPQSVSLPDELSLPASYEDSITSAAQRAEKADAVRPAPAPPKPVVPSRLVKSPEPKVDPLTQAVEQARTALEDRPQSVSLPSEASLPLGYENQIAQLAQKANKADAAKPAPTPAPASPAPVVVESDLPFKITKVDAARITALDKELGAESTARSLRHDPRFASMSHAERVQAVRKISQEPARALPGKGMRAIDEKFNAIEPSKRAAYVETWKAHNPAVYAYLQAKL